ncbi:hypothetical protein [Dechloromonas sp. HYN0024]|uniref:hypothetical protein n=1 Tax=Dechloromonas sp. HYN0024 TaxID=2231055 RepID=UPI000E44527A|nr:hypothetical protein [Dechloromonas sp. HYN0024]AXS79861.1 hypothetical protein HYN24_07425 [Dechloromonas sp. HYN0024]
MASLTGFYTNPYGPTNGGDLGLGNTLTVADIGPQDNGTYGIPLAAQPANDPQNTAGYSSSISPQVAGLLSQGIGAMTRLGMGAMQLDYARAEATNGGLYYQGRYAGIPRNGYGQVNQPMNLSVILLIGALAYLLLKD